MKIRNLIPIAAISLALVQIQVIRAQPAPPPGAPGDGANAPDVPGRAARLSFLSGQVSYQPGSVEDWIPAMLNRPLTTGDRLWTEAGARAEINLGSAAIRLNGRTNFTFINLDDRTAQMQISAGTVSVRVRSLADDEVVEIDTPQAALSLLRPGEYRVDVDEQGDTTIATVRRGQAEATGGQAFTIHPREQVRIVSGADGAPPTFDTRDIPLPDPFDNLCSARDRREDLSQSARYVSRDIPGYADLDRAGT
ncbi:MAG: FecR domain-containing protein, partial [Bryobacteraceae bacterium]